MLKYKYLLEKVDYCTVCMNKKVPIAAAALLQCKCMCMHQPWLLNKKGEKNDNDATGTAAVDGSAMMVGSAHRKI